MANRESALVELTLVTDTFLTLRPTKAVRRPSGIASIIPKSPPDGQSTMRSIDQNQKRAFHDYSSTRRQASTKRS